MLLTWRPPDGEVREFVFRPEKLMSVEAELVESLGGDVWDNFDQFGTLFIKGNRRAWRAALWVMLKRDRDKPPPRFDMFEVGAYDLTLDYDKEETAVLRREIANQDDLDEEQKKAIIEIIGGEEEDDEVAHPLEPSDSPPGPAGTAAAETSTGGPSVIG